MALLDIPTDRGRAGGGEVGMTDSEFMTHIICEICDYALQNDMEPNDTLSTIANNIKALLRISTFNNWKVKQDG